MENRKYHKYHKSRWTALALACLFLAACKDKHEPLKPTVAAPAVVAAAAAAAK